MTGLENCRTSATTLWRPRLLVALLSIVSAPCCIAQEAAPIEAVRYQLLMPYQLLVSSRSDVHLMYDASYEKFEEAAEAYRAGNSLHAADLFVGAARGFEPLAAMELASNTKSVLRNRVVSLENARYCLKDAGSTARLPEIEALLEAAVKRLDALRR